MRATWLCSAVAAVGILLGAARAQAVAPGTLILTDEQVDTSGSFEKTIQKAARQVIEKKGDQWTVYLVAFLKKPAGSSQVNLVFYDLATKDHEPVNAFPITTQAAAKILTSSVSFGVDQGFIAGHKYNVLITRLIGGREEVYAKTTVALR